jgi:hypothetical protein
MQMVVRLIGRPRVIGEYLIGDPEGSVGVGHSAIDGGLQQQLLDLVVGHAVAARGPHMHRQLLVMAAGDQRGERDQRPAAPIQARARPDRAPCVLRDEVLELRGEIRCGRDGPVHVSVAEHLASYRHPRGVHVGVHMSGDQLGDAVGRLSRC